MLGNDKCFFWIINNKYLKEKVMTIQTCIHILERHA